MVDRVVIELTGGLGNQLFQYAYGLFLRETEGCDFVCVFRNRGTIRELTLNRLFNLRHPIVGSETVTSMVDLKPYDLIFGERYFTVFNKLFKHKNFVEERRSQPIERYNKIYIKGYWQDIVYPQEFFDLVRKELTYRDSFLQSQSRSNRLLGKDVIGVHVRRGDYVTNAKARRVLGALSMNYYLNAINQLVMLTGSKKVKFFSDNPNWINNNILGKINLDLDVEVVQSRSVTQDFYELSGCEYKILSNSSLSWWAAQLSIFQKKPVFCPNQWFLNRDGLEGINIPEDWIKIDR